MIKKIYLSLIFITAAFLFGALPATANDWGVFPIYETDNLWKDKYLFYKVLEDIPIKYSITKAEDADIKNESSRTLNELETLFEELNKISIAQKEDALFEKVISTGFNTWLKDTKQMIIDENRQEEFADIMPILSKEVSLIKVSDDKDADISIIFASPKLIKQICGDDAFGCEQTILGKMILPNNFSNGEDSNKTQAITTHEIGHLYGLVDQYNNIYSRYSNPKDFHYTSYRIGKYNSLMAAYSRPNLACDDVDGFINLIDLTSYLKNKQENNAFQNEPDDKYWSKRAKNGWASFCNGKRNAKGELFINEFYKKAKLAHLELPGGAKDPFSSIYDTKKIYGKDAFFIADKEKKLLYNFEQIVEYGIIRKKVSVLRFKDRSIWTLYKYRSFAKGTLWQSELFDNESIEIIDSKRCIVEKDNEHASDTIISFHLDENNKLKLDKEESSSNLSEEQINIARAKCDFMMWKPIPTQNED